MRDYAILTDATCDLNAEMLEKLKVTALPMGFSIEEDSYMHYPDAREYSIQSFYADMRAGKRSVTAQVNEQACLEAFEPYLKEGKDLLYIAFSSALSGTCLSAQNAAEKLSAKYPDAKVLVVDSKAASMGEGLLIYHAAMLKQDGKSIDEVAQWLTDNRLRLCHWFTVDDLNHLKRGGRLSGTAAFFGTLLNIKPILHVDDEGRLIPMEKVRGRRQSIEALAEHMAKTYDAAKPQMIFISHGDCLSDAEYLKKCVKERCKAIKDVEIGMIGPVIGAHSGPGTVAVFFLGAQR